MANPYLNDRETEILRLIGEGRTSAQIAAALSLSAETIKWYRKKLLVKFDAENTAVLIRKAATAGLI
jgi:DNA-binding CsgD family transcriptional regulator